MTARSRKRMEWPIYHSRSDVVRGSGRRGPFYITRRTICYDSGFGTRWPQTASNMLRGARRSVILRKYPLLRNGGKAPADNGGSASPRIRLFLGTSAGGSKCSISYEG